MATKPEFLVAKEKNNVSRIGNCVSCSPARITELCVVIERLRFSSTPNGRREFVPRDQVFPLFFVHSLLLLHKSKKFYASFNHMNRSGLFLPACFLF